MIKEYIWTGQKFHGVDGFNGVFHDRKADINLGLNTYNSQQDQNNSEVAF